MKAAFFSDINKVELREFQEPEIEAADRVKVRILNTGICASDIIGLQGNHPTRKPPVVSGHESSGVIVGVGPGVKEFRCGDRVAIEPQYGCGKCPACRSGRYNACQNKTVLGTAKWSGSFAEYITAPQEALLKLPGNVSFEQGALLEPLAVGMHAARLSGIGTGGTAAVIGSGPIGLACMLGCKLCGSGKVVMLDILDYNLGIAEKLGADETVNCKKRDAIGRVMEVTDGEGADVVFIAVGIPTAITDSCAMAKVGGRIMLLAHFGSRQPDFDVAKLRYRELSMTGTVMYTKSDYIACMNAMVQGKIDPTPMITKIFPIEDCASAFELAQKRTEDFIKLMFSF